MKKILQLSKRLLTIDYLMLDRMSAKGLSNCRGMLKRLLSKVKMKGYYNCQVIETKTKNPYEKVLVKAAFDLCPQFKKNGELNQVSKLTPSILNTQVC